MPTPRALTVFDPPMCCSSGLCGPDVDPTLVRFSDALFWLARHGVRVTRHNLAQEPGAFVAHEAVIAALRQRGEACLPIVIANGEIVSSGAYPERDALASWAGIDPAAVDVELVMLGGTAPSGGTADG